MNRILLALIPMIFFAGVLCGSEAATENLARIGVLAYRGTDNVDRRWNSLIQYLDGSVEGWKFEVIPVTLVSAERQIANGDLDFILTNPGHFVALHERFSMSVIASRRQQKSDGTFVGEFGSAIIARQGSGITSLAHVRGKAVAAVDRHAFGGFQLAWYELNNVGVDLFTETSSLNFTGFPMDQVVWQVIKGEVDVGIVRSGLIEQLTKEKVLDPNLITVLNRNAAFQHPDMISTRLYPEWPFVAFSSTNPLLKDRVALALLVAQNSERAALIGLTDIWSAPVSYQSVVELSKAYESRILVNPIPASSFSLALRILFWVLGLSALAVTAIVVLRVFQTSRLRLDSVMVEGLPDTNHSGTVATTPREEEVLNLIMRGHSTKEIGRSLGISPKTVEFHRANLLKKFGARTSIQLIAIATKG